MAFEGVRSEVSGLRALLIPWSTKSLVSKICGRFPAPGACRESREWPSMKTRVTVITSELFKSPCISVGNVTSLRLVKSLPGVFDDVPDHTQTEWVRGVSKPSLRDTGVGRLSNRR